MKDSNIDKLSATLTKYESETRETPSHNSFSNLLQSVRRQPWHVRLWVWLKVWLKRKLRPTPPPFLHHSVVMKFAEEMFLRGYMTDSEFIYLAVNISHPDRFRKEELLTRIKSFILSGEWKEPVSPVQGNYHNGLRSPIRGGCFVTAGAASPSMAPPPRDPPLKGSKAIQQIVEGYGIGGSKRSRLGANSPEQLDIMYERLNDLLEEKDKLETLISGTYRDIDEFIEGKVTADEKTTATGQETLDSEGLPHNRD